MCAQVPLPGTLVLVLGNSMRLPVLAASLQQQFSYIRSKSLLGFQGSKITAFVSEGTLPLVDCSRYI